MEQSKRHKFGKKLGGYGIFLVFVAMFILFSFIAPNFLQLNNIFNVARQVCTLGICAVGMTIIMITGGIDLSLGYQISLTNVVCAWLMVTGGLNPVAAVIIAILMNTGIGIMNGLIIVKSHVAPLIVTLAVLNILNGLSFMVSKGLPIFGFPASFAVAGQGSIGGFPISLIVMIAIFVVGAVILTKTYFGRYFYAIGSNEEAAKLSGINTAKLKILAYGLGGFLTSIERTADVVAYQFRIILKRRGIRIQCHYSVRTGRRKRSGR